MGALQEGGYELPRASANGAQKDGICGEDDTPVDVQGASKGVIHCVCSKSGNCRFEKLTVSDAKQRPVVDKSSSQN